jgi:hypothetical protein
MATYLGDNKQKLLSLVGKQLFEKNITQYEISNDKGHFTGYKVIDDGVEGFAYYHSGGDFYEFSPESDFTVNASRSIPVTASKKLSLGNYHDAILAERDIETKLVDSHKISFLNIFIEQKSLVGIKGIVDNEKGFVFKEIQNGLQNESQDRTRNYFVKADDVIDYGVLSSKELITVSEKLHLHEVKKEKETMENLERIKELNISISGFDNTRDSLRLKQIIGRIDGLEIKEQEISGEYSMGALVKKIGTIGKERSIARVNSELLSFGVAVKVTSNLNDGEIDISILDKKGKELSKLSTNNVTFESEDFNVGGEDVNFKMVVLDLENEYETEGKYIKIEENGKNVTLNKSKFKELYSVFDKDAHVVDYHDDLDTVSELKTKDGDFNFDISSISLTDELSFKSRLLSEIKIDKNLKKTVKNASKGSSPKPI